MFDDKTYENMNMLKKGETDGFPIGLVYFAVAFSLGIAAKNVGMNVLQGFIMSFTTIASAGEYAGISIIASNGSLLEMVLITIVTDIRYVLMSCALTQRFDPRMPFIHKLGVGALITDELFGLAISRPGYVRPTYTYGAAIIAVPMWAIGTACGIAAGNIMPDRLVSALSVALYGMFVAIVIPPGKENHTILFCVAASYGLSWLAGVCLPMLSAGTRIILLIVAISSAAAVIAPVKEEEAK